MWTETMPIHRQGSTTGYSESAIYLDDQINLIAVMVRNRSQALFHESFARRSKVFGKLFQR